MLAFDRRASIAALAALLLSTGAALAQQPSGAEESGARPSFEAPPPAAPTEHVRSEPNSGNAAPAPAVEARSETPSPSEAERAAEQRGAPVANAGPPKLTPAEIAAALASRARAEKMDGQNAEGIADDAEVVKPILARHPDSNLIICVAGCGPEPSIVQVLPREPENQTESQVVPSSGELGGASGAAANGSAAAPREANEVDIVCVAGCLKKRGEVVHRRAKVSWLSPQEIERMTPLLRRVAQRLVGNLAVASADDEPTSQAFDVWSRMSRAIVDGGMTVAEQSGE